MTGRRMGLRQAQPDGFFTQKAQRFFAKETKRWNDYRNINAKLLGMIRGSGSNVYSTQIDEDTATPERAE